MEAKKGTGPNLIEKSKATAFITMGVALGLIVGFSFGFYLSNRWNHEALAAKGTSNKSMQQAQDMPEGHPTVDQQGAGMAPVFQKLEELKKKVAADPKDFQSRAELGNMYFDARKFDQAIDWYRQALEIKPDDVDVRTDLGTAYHFVGQHDKAIEELEKALARDPNHAFTLLNLGMVRLRGKNDKKGAIQAWEKFIATNPDLKQATQVKEWVTQLKEGKDLQLR
jgi:tetratricopeptide (TPR) repeat protein